jgi:hypothetical protein
MNTRYYLIMGDKRVHGWFPTLAAAQCTQRTFFDNAVPGHVGMVIAAAPDRPAAMIKAEACWSGKMRLAEARRP